MRPIDKGLSPITGEYDDYRDSFVELVARLGPYCSYCERRIPTNLAVEHIQPKSLTQYTHLKGSWNNFLLGCVNCNSSKGSKDLILSNFFLPDRDNTFSAYAYDEAGIMNIANGLNSTQQNQAKAMRRITGLHKPSSEAEDQNGNLVAIDRVSQRMESWLIAQLSKEDLSNSPSEEIRNLIVRTAIASGYFSIWMKVFEDDTDMRTRLINEFPGTANDCFDEYGNPVSPRPANNLANGGKI